VEYGYDANIILALRKYARVCVSEPVSQKWLYLAVIETSWSEIDLGSKRSEVRLMPESVSSAPHFIDIH